MSNLNTTLFPRSYDEAVEILGGRTERKIGYKTTLRMDVSRRCVHVRHDDTDIVTHYQTGHVRLDDGGLRSRTTKFRMNACLPKHAQVYQEDHEWFVRNCDSTYPFHTGDFHLVNRFD